MTKTMTASINNQFMGKENTLLCKVETYVYTLYKVRWWSSSEGMLPFTFVKLLSLKKNRPEEP